MIIHPLIATPSKTLFALPYWIAVHRGFFKDEGLTPSLEFVASGERINEGLRNGRVTLAVLSGLATWLIRVTEWETGTYWAYMVHLVFMFEFFIYLPFSKAAHIFYRLTAMTWSYYTGRGL